MRNQTLNMLNKGEKAIISDFSGGFGLKKKLDALGIRRGKEIKKISNSFIGGPVTLEIGNNKIAIGQRMADKIIVEVKG